MNPSWRGAQRRSNLGFPVAKIEIASLHSVVRNDIFLVFQHPVNIIPQPIFIPLIAHIKGLLNYLPLGPG
jgi:hypothetical protein